MEQYIRDVKLELNKDHMRDFWTEFGYLDENCDIASLEGRFVKKRFVKIPSVVQCDQCLKWRSWPNAPVNCEKEYPDCWSCENLHGDK